MKKIYLFIAICILVSCASAPSEMKQDNITKWDSLEKELHRAAYTFVNAQKRNIPVISLYSVTVPVDTSIDVYIHIHASQICDQYRLAVILTDDVDQMSLSKQHRTDLLTEATQKFTRLYGTPLITSKDDITNYEWQSLDWYSAVTFSQTEDFEVIFLFFYADNL